MSNRIQSSSTTALAAMTGAALLLGLTACTNITNLVQNQHEETFANVAKAEAGWVGVGMPAWIPDDATEIHSVATNNEQVAVIRVVSTSALPAECAPADRRGIPALGGDWVPQEWPDTVSLCGEYEVMPADDGWVGWFNAAAEGDVPDQPKG